MLISCARLKSVECTRSCQTKHVCSVQFLSLCRIFFLHRFYCHPKEATDCWLFFPQNLPTLWKSVLTLRRVAKERHHSPSDFSRYPSVQKGWLHVLATCKDSVPSVILEEVYGLPFVYRCPSDSVSVRNEVGDRIPELQCLCGLRKLRARICPRKSVINWDSRLNLLIPTIFLGGSVV